MARGDVVVVGAGLAGLAAALELKDAGCNVHLFERSRLLGGKATSFTVDGVEVDNGQHVYLACCTQFIDFVNAIGGENLLSLQPRFEALVLAHNRPPARLVEVRAPTPWNLAPALLGYGHADLATRGRLALALLAARRPPRPGETFGQWLDRHHQTQATRRVFWEPFLVPALNAPLDAVGAGQALFVIATAFRGTTGAARFGFARVPLARIAEMAVRRVDHVFLRRPVAHIKHRGDAVCGVTLEDGETVRSEGVILAVPPNRLSRLIGNTTDLGISDVRAFRFAPIVDVHLWYDRPVLGFGFAAVLDSAVQWIFEKAPGYLCCSLSAADALVSRPSTELVDLCDRELRAVLPELGGVRLVRGSATRDREATFVPVPGLRRPGPGTSLSGLMLAGAWTDTGWPATMESAVRSGRQAARALLAQLDGGAHRHGRDDG